MNREKLRGEAYRIWMDIFGGLKIHPIDERGIERFVDWAESLQREDRAEIERLRKLLDQADSIIKLYEAKVNLYEAAEARAAAKTSPEERMAERQAGIDQGQQ